MRRAASVLLILLAGTVGFFLALLSPVRSNPTRTAVVHVNPGESLPRIAGSLEAAGMIRDASAFELLARLRGKARELKAGPYRLRSDAWAWETLDQLVVGDVEDTSVTVAEGLWMAEIAERVGPWIQGGAEAFLDAARDPGLLSELGVGQASAEGYLFPETYRVLLDTPGPDMVRHMVRTFLEVWDRELAGRAGESGISRHDAVTLASIVEAEAGVASERPRIAAVYRNRLSRGMPLQADPTVHYGLGERRSRTLYADLRDPSPYNTYLRPGLPPGPICSPGFDSMRAVLWPEEGCRDLYFVAVGDGTHLFATDFAGHQRNRRLVREVQAESGSRAEPVDERSQR